MEPAGALGRLPRVTTLDIPAGRIALVGAAWTGATLFGLVVAWKTEVGPIVASLSYNHGIHLGDLVAFAGAYLVAAVITAGAFEGHQNRPHQNRK